MLNGTIIENLVQLVYPNICVGCNHDKAISDQLLCLYCTSNLPYTDHLESIENAFVRHFWGRIPIVHGAAFWLYTPHEITQHIIHQLKYRSRKDIGVKMGTWFGQHILGSSQFKHIDIIIPVPLHTKKRLKRGYNQSFFIAQGLSDVLGIPIHVNSLCRIINTPSQTRKSRKERLSNLANAFALNKRYSPDLEGKHILLVDDVMTTGATLEICALSLLSIPNTKISMATLAMGS